MGDEEKKGPKFDQVAINKIFLETIKKERSIMKLNENFRLNPKQLAANIITEKPNVDPSRAGFKLSAEPEMIAELDGIIKETKKVPTEKYSEPVTTSHEIGWFSEPLMKSRKKFGLKSNEITSYADAYTQAMGRNPFAKRDPIVKQEA
mmetsp:Transcript_21889/g.34301  ORF Transcript_21889/g.34301 Transcript_21889/m.34301 type:complete len:148 (-) Transcript_21889:2016-2459(-)